MSKLKKEKMLFLHKWRSYSRYIASLDVVIVFCHLYNMMITRVYCMCNAEELPSYVTLQWLSYWWCIDFEKAIEVDGLLYLYMKVVEYYVSLNCWASQHWVWQLFDDIQKTLVYNYSIWIGE